MNSKMNIYIFIAFEHRHMTRHPLSMESAGGAMVHHDIKTWIVIFIISPALFAAELEPR